MARHLALNQTYAGSNPVASNGSKALVVMHRTFNPANQVRLLVGPIKGEQE